MANSEFGGVIDSSKTYTQKSLAIILDREEEWVFENVIHAGCQHSKFGRVYFVSGKSFQLFIESRSERWKPPSKRGKRKTNVGDETEG